MRKTSAVALALLLSPAPGSCVSMEAARAYAEKAFAGAFLAAPAAVAPILPAPSSRRPGEKGPLRRKAFVEPLATAPDRSMGRVDLASLLDRHWNLFSRRLGVHSWTIGAAGSAGFEKFFLTFSQSGRILVSPLGDDFKRLLRGGVDIAVEPGLVYNFRVELNFFDPIRGSTVRISPARGTRGPAHELSTGAVLDAARARAHVFKIKGAEYWLFYGTDVDAALNRLAGTRSLAFVRMNGRDSKMWAVDESALEPGKPYTISLGEARLAVVRTAAAELLLYNAR